MLNSLANRKSAVRFMAAVCCCLMSIDPTSAEDRWQLPPGFEMVQTAGDELATNIFCMIALRDGSALVSGPGYIRKLIDDDADGVFDRFELVSDFPKSGAQGMAVDGTDLLCVGDGGVWRLPGALKKEQNAKSAKPIRLVEISTKGEHHAHAIRRSFDNWYLIAGNQTEFEDGEGEQVSGPVPARRAGFLMKFNSDFSKRLVLAHGFRNAYDFDFNSKGQLFTYDSDGERDASLPWYRPTRVFEIEAGDDAGWVTKSWKRPSSYFDMPHLIGDAGRGSPTGVVCHPGNQFPLVYDDAIFAGDWTFGRVIVCMKDPETGSYEKPHDFLQAGEGFGFPVTDLAIGRDGSLLISVGGRGTQGGIYRVSYNGNDALGPKQIFSLRVPPPNQAELDRSIEIVKETLDSLIRFGDTGRRPIDFKTLDVAAKSDEPSVWRSIIRIVSVYAEDPEWTSKVAESSLAEAGYSDRLKLLVSVATAKNPVQRKQVLLQLMRAMRLEGEHEVFPLATTCRMAQLALGGVGAVDGVFSGLAPQQPVDFSAAELGEFAEVLSNRIFLPKDRLAQQELGRLAVMLGASSDELAVRFLEQIDEQTAVSDDIHWLSCLARMKLPDDADFCQQAATALKSLNRKVKRQGRKTDSHWQPLLAELATELLGKNELIAKAVLADDFGSPAHAFMFGAFPQPHHVALYARVNAWCRENPKNVVDEQVRVLAMKPTKSGMETLRMLSAQKRLRDATILALADHAELADFGLMKLGLRSRNPTVIKRSAIALRKINVPALSEIAKLALQAALRLGNERQDVSVRDQLVLLLRQQTGKQFGYQTKQPDKSQSKALLEWKAALIKRWPQLEGRFESRESNADQIERLAKLAFDSGDVTAGKVVFDTLQCARCHDGNSAQGPRLEGVTRRLGTTDLLTAIVDPDRQVSDRYRATLFETSDGLLHSGLIIYESVDGVTLKESSGETVRLNQSQIENRARGNKSLMPAGLLDRASDQEVRDLIAYLKKLE